jgi:integrase
LTLFYTGCRISEALNETAGRVDLTERTLVFETLKRRRRGCFRGVPLPDSLAALLKELVGAADPHANVWKFSRATGYRLVKDYMTKAGIMGGMASRPKACDTLSRLLVSRKKSHCPPFKNG